MGECAIIAIYSFETGLYILLYNRVFNFIHMGVKGLLKLLESEAPAAVTTVTLPQLTGQTVAIDASISIYQFLGVFTTGGKPIVNKRGEHINHLQGFFFRTLQLLENGINVKYVFDGEPPEVKAAKLDERRKVRKIRIGPGYFEDVHELLYMMGVDVIDAKGEAEATCSRLAAGGRQGVTMVGSDDIDCLAFGAPSMIKKLAVGGAKTIMKQVSLQPALDGLKLTHAQFIDLCILLGSDYSPSIPGVGPKRALELIRKYGDLDVIIKAVDKGELVLTIPAKFDYKGARKAFIHPKVTLTVSRRGKYSHPDLRDFLISKGLDVTRTNNGLERLKKIMEARRAARQAEPADA